MANYFTFKLKAPSAPETAPMLEANWPALQVFCLFRFLLALTFLGFMKLNAGPAFLGHTHGALYAATSHFYLAFSALTLLLVMVRRPKFFLQVNVPVFLDAATIVLLMHSSGGVLSGLGLLLIVVVAAQTLLTPGRLSLLIASLSSLAVLSEEVYSDYTNVFIDTAYSQAGMLGLAIFISAFACNRLSLRAQKNQALAKARGEHLAASLQLNAHVVSTMQEGVIVFDNNYHIQLINSSAENLLAINGEKELADIHDLPWRFQSAFNNIISDTHPDEHFQITKDSPEIRLVIKHLSDDQDKPTGTLVFLYDIAKEKQQAQTLKLAALGSLAANIAHEIRNPLSSVSHAAQLMNESIKISQDDLTLVNIIKENSDRMNVVIKNVLDLSRKQEPCPETINLNHWLKGFVEELKIPGIKKLDINLSMPDREPLLHCDPSQLRQILLNLCENGLRYSMQKSGKATLNIKLKPLESNQALQLDIIDDGDGPEPGTVKRLFEPFFTTEETGSGLGLYIAKELCQLNGGSLNFLPGNQKGGHFRLHLPEHQGAQ